MIQYNEKLIQDLMLEEGYVATIHPDSKNTREIGYGHNLDTNRLTPDEFSLILGMKIDTVKQGEIMLQNKMSKTLAKELLVYDINKVVKDIAKRNLPYWKSLSLNRQMVLIEMAYQLGVPGMMSFKKMHSALIRGDFVGAGLAMIDSLWFKQTKQRALELAYDMINNTFRVR